MSQWQSPDYGQTPQFPQGGQPYQQPYYPPQYQPPQRPRESRKSWLGIGCLGLSGLVVTVIALAASHPSSSSAPGAIPTLPTVAVSQAAAHPSAAAGQAVTYEVTGSPADVTYGPAGSNAQGTVPMSKTSKIPSAAPAYYAVSAQLQGSGSVTCKIKIGGKVISRATATGSYNIADCEIVQNPLTGQWQDTNAA